MEAAADGCEGQVRVLGVTVLTSMHADDLEEVMTQFINGEADVLLSTTIMASLMMSAAVPWIGVLMAVRSANLRRESGSSWFRISFMAFGSSG